MVGKSIIVGMLAIAIMSVAPGLGFIVLIGGGIAVAVWQGSEEKAANTSKYGYDPVRQDYNKLPAEQKARVDAIKEAKEKAKKDESDRIYNNYINGITQKREEQCRQLRAALQTTETAKPSIKYAENKPKMKTAMPTDDLFN